MYGSLCILFFSLRYTSVAQYEYIIGNLKIENLSSTLDQIEASMFPKLRCITGSLTVSHNGQLLNLQDGFPLLAEVEENVIVSDNAFLTSLANFAPKLVSVNQRGVDGATDGVIVSNNKMLADMTGAFDALRSAHTVTINKNPSLTALGKDGPFQNLEIVRATFSINRNANLMSLSDTFQSLLYVEAMEIGGNGELTTLAGIAKNLYTAGTVRVVSTLLYMYIYIDIYIYIYIYIYMPLCTWLEFPLSPYVALIIISILAQ